MSHTDLSKVEGTITNKVTSLISRMDRMNEDDIRDEFDEILLSQTTKVGVHTINKWQNSMNRAKGKIGAMQMVTNLYLAGSNLSINQK